MFCFSKNLQMLDEQPVPTEASSQLRHYFGLPVPGGTVQCLHAGAGGV